MIIRKAEAHEFDAVRGFYHELIDTAPYVPLWEKDVFPEDADLSDAIAEGSLFVGIADGRIISSVIAYQEGDIEHLNLLGVLPSYTRMGFARQMVSFVIETARKKHLSAVQLEVLKENTGAENLYTSMGFVYKSSFEEFFDRTGKMVFKVYEFKL